MGRYWGTPLCPSSMECWDFSGNLDFYKGSLVSGCLPSLCSPGAPGHAYEGLKLVRGACQFWSSYWGLCDPQCTGGWVFSHVPWHVVLVPIALIQALLFMCGFHLSVVKERTKMRDYLCCHNDDIVVRLDSSYLCLRPTSPFFAMMPRITLFWVPSLLGRACRH